MPAAPQHQCGWPGGCPELVDRGRARCPTHERAADRQRSNVDVRLLYGTVRWKNLRRRVLRQEPCCPECQAEEGRFVPNTDVHHLQKHHGDLRLFFSRANLQGLCHAHHSRHTQRGE